LGGSATEHAAISSRALSKLERKRCITWCSHGARHAVTRGKVLSEMLKMEFPKQLFCNNP